MGFDAIGCLYEMELTKADSTQALAKVLKVKENNSRLDQFQISLGQSLPKAAKMDLILRQGTEVGIHRFIPIVTVRSISRPQEFQYEHKKDRWKKIILEATRQCGRKDIPQLDGVTEWQQCLELMKEFDQVLIPYEKEAPALKTVLESKPAAHKILVLVGPEGGWTREEVISGEQYGATPVHLQTPILRTETAGIVIVSMIQFFKSTYETGKEPNEK